MWYHGVLPTMGIIFGCLAAPTVVNYYLCKLVQNGNAYRRELVHPTNLHLYWRDMRLTGSPYVMKGLNNIPDTDEEGKTDDDRGANGDQTQGKTKVFTDPSYHTTPCPPKDK